jgi:two-component sensor histidine kinase
LGKALVLSMYRTYMEMYKEEKTLKESVYLRNIKKEIQDFTFTHKEDSESGSDSEAEETMNEERE